jgi:protein-S-isoprenylcysteine O-methyltransferase Ste14
MQTHGFIVLASFSILIISLFILGFLLRNKTRNFLGKPTIDNVYFYSGKLGIFSSWTLFMLKAIFPKIGYIDVPPFLSWAGTILMCIGSLIMIISFYGLGTSLKVGIPDEDTILKTKGIYRFSRNPLYFGVFLITIASCLYFPDLLNIALSLYGIIMHHKITLGEEKFLENRFGDNWKTYKSSVRRYI